MGHIGPPQGACKCPGSGRGLPALAQPPREGLLPPPPAPPPWVCHGSAVPPKASCHHCDCLRQQSRRCGVPPPGQSGRHLTPCRVKVVKCTITDCHDLCIHSSHAHPPLYSLLFSPKEAPVPPCMWWSAAHGGVTLWVLGGSHLPRAAGGTGGTLPLANRHRRLEVSTLHKEVLKVCCQQLLHPLVLGQDSPTPLQICGCSDMPWWGGG